MGTDCCIKWVGLTHKVTDANEKEGDKKEAKLLSEGQVFVAKGMVLWGLQSDVCLTRSRNYKEACLTEGRVTGRV